MSLASRTAAPTTSDAADPAEPGWIRRMMPFLRPHWRDLALVFGAALGSTLATVVLPLVTRTIVDDAIMTSARARLSRWKVPRPTSRTCSC